MDTRRIIKALEADGWQHIATKGDHWQSKHSVKPDRDTPQQRKAIWGQTSMTSYIALIRNNVDSDYGVDFPDFPGCVTAGRTLEEARSMAVQALALHVEGMAEDGEQIPDPASLDAIMADLVNNDAVAILVDAPTKPSRAIRIDVTLPGDLLEQIARVTRNRSRFLTEAARARLKTA